MRAADNKLIVRPERIEDTDPMFRRAKAAGLVIPDNESEREQMAQVKAVVVDVGPNAFHELSAGEWMPWQGEHPKAGDRVVIAKYAGLQIEESGEHYRIINDRDVTAIVEHSDD